MRRAGGWLVWLGVFVALAPLISLAVAYAIAGLAGCPLNEGSVSRCAIFGAEMGKTLYQMSVAGWYMFFSMPLGLVLGFAGALLRSLNPEG